MNPVRETHNLSIPLLLVLAVVLAGLLPSPSALSQTLESRVENLEAHDEILRSRQEVLTSDVSDFKAEVAGATTAIRAEMAAVRAEMAAEDAAVSAIAVPVGGVIAWWGELGSIPENFELCDGNPPTTPGAVLTGNKPDLRERFVRGANLAVGTTGGEDTIEDATTAPHQLTVEEMPSHNHVSSWYDRLVGINGQYTMTSSDNTAGEPNLRYAGNIAFEGGDEPHSHGISGHDNRPAFCELFYIIRVK